MKKLIILFLINLLLTVSVIGQIYNPTFSRREVSYCDIVKIEKSSSSTIVYFKFKAPSTGVWVCAGKDFFIRDCNTRSTYKLIKANNIPLCPEKHDFQYQGQTLEFNLVFPELPSNTNKIDIIEDEAKGGFNFYGVNLTSSTNQTAETKTLKSEGKLRESDSPLSDVISIIPAGAKVKVLSSSGGYYKIEYNGKTGYISELYFQSSGISSNNSTSSKSSSNNSQINCNEIKSVSATSKPSFQNMLAGVKYAVIKLSKNQWTCSCF